MSIEIMQLKSIYIYQTMLKLTTKFWGCTLGSVYDTQLGALMKENKWTINESMKW